MFNSAAKLQLGLAAVALVMAVGYGFAIDDPGGFVVMMGVCVALGLAGLAVAGSGFTDHAPRYLTAEDAPPMQMVSVDRSPLSRPSAWPLVGAISIGILGVGLAVGHLLVFIGIIAGLMAGAGWLAQDWREDPSYSPRLGSRIVERLVAPLGLPLLAVCIVAVIVISVSRVLLAVPKNDSVALALLIAVLVLAAFFLLSSRPPLARTSLVLLSGFAVVAVISAGSVSAGTGYRTFEKHQTGPGPTTVVAQGTQYKQKMITVIQGHVAQIIFKNLDRGVYHDVAVYGAPTGGNPYWNGEPVRGVKNITYTHQFDMAPGTYSFRCDFHPTMVGTFRVQAAP